MIFHIIVSWYYNISDARFVPGIKTASVGPTGKLTILESDWPGRAGWLAG